MIRCTLLTLIFSATILLSRGQEYYSQKDNFLKANSVWAFQKKTGLDFRAGSPKPISSAMFGNSLSEEGASSVCDPNTGELLFYSNGINVWNKNGVVMPNGSGILSGNSTAQGVCIVPLIGEMGKYYLFSLYGSSNTPYPIMNTSSGFASLSYSIVDMSLDAGRGDIISGKKNIALSLDSLSEAMIAVPGNNCDIWLMVHKLIDPVFKAYHITAGGIDTIPVLSETGSGIRGKGTFMGTYAYKISCMAVSPDRTRLAITSKPGIVLGPPATELAGALVCKFDPGTGVVSDAIKLTHTAVYGVAFSPDNTKLYIGGDNLPQFDISNYDSLAIGRSRTDLSPTILDTYLRLYRDTIYSKTAQSSSATQLASIDRINQPNNKGLACNLQTKAIIFTDTTAPAHICLPTEVVYPMPGDTFRSLLLDTLACTPQIRITGPANQKEYTWEDGSKDPIRTVAVPGKYWLSSAGSCHTRIDTFLVDGGIEKPVIRVEEFELSTTTTYTSYQWLYDGTAIPGATAEKYTVTKNGAYQVIGTNTKGCQDTSEIYPVNNVSLKTPDNPLQVRVYPNPANDNLYLQTPVPLNITLYDASGRLCLSAEQTKIIPVRHLAGGLYTIVISDNQNNLLQRERITIIRH